MKWNKQSFDKVEFDPALGVANLKEVIQKLTNVPPDRQKLMAKGAWPGTLKDDANLSLLPIKTGQQVMLMGTADVVAPVEKSVFLEDMTSEEKAKTGVVPPQGFANLGNTCYLNSVLQVIRCMPAVRESLAPVRPAGGFNALPTMDINGRNVLLAASLRDTLSTLDKSGEPMQPFTFVQLVRTIYPQYAQQSGQNGMGGYVQQDAEEFFNTCVSVLAAAADKAQIASLMQLELEETMECVEEVGGSSSSAASTGSSAAVTVSKHKEWTNKLVCNIQNTVITADAKKDVKNVDTMLDGIVLNMEGTCLWVQLKCIVNHSCMCV